MEMHCDTCPAVYVCLICSHVHTTIPTYHNYTHMKVLGTTAALCGLRHTMRLVMFKLLHRVHDIRMLIMIKLPA